MTSKINAASIYIFGVRYWINIIGRVHVYKSIFKVKGKLVNRWSRNYDIN